MKKSILKFIFFTSVSFYTSAQVSDFENLTLSGSNSFWTTTVNASFTTAGIQLKQTIDFGYWDTGFSYSNVVNTTLAGYANQYAAITGNGFQNSEKYAICYNSNSKIIFDSPRSVSGFYITNSTYAYLSMRNGDSFAKKFGGVSGNDRDYFKVKANAYQNGILNTNTGVDFYLADFRFGSNSQDYIVNTWKWFSLTALGVADSLIFTFESSDVGSFGINTPKYFAMDNFNGTPPIDVPRNIVSYAPQVGFGTNDAINKDDLKIKSWASGCTIQTGWVDINNKNLGKPSFGTTASGIGKSDGNLVSLGDSGVAILTFDNPIKNGSGPDFAVFENGFLYQNAGLAFLELAFVDVSSDGTNYFRFPATSNTQIQTQIAGFEYLDATKINNLAGKYLANYGTPFDLEELKTVPGLDVNNITHVKITDVIGSISPFYASYDSNNNVINDPYSTTFSTSGFDLDAVAVLNQVGENNIAESIDNKLKIYPTILKSGEKIHILGEDILSIKIINSTGQNIDFQANKNEITLNSISKGMYLLQIHESNKIYTQKFMIE